MAQASRAKSRAAFPEEAGWAAPCDRKGSPSEAGRTEGRNNVEDPERSGGLRHAAAGLEGSAAHTAHAEESQTKPASRESAMTTGARIRGRSARGRRRRAETQRERKRRGGSVHEHPARA